MTRKSPFWRLTGVLILVSVGSGVAASTTNVSVDAAIAVRRGGTTGASPVRTSAGSTLLLAGLSEENLPPQELPKAGNPAGKATSSPSPATPDAADDWQEVTPGDATSSPSAPTTGTAGTITVPTASAAAGTATPSSGGNGADVAAVPAATPEVEVPSGDQQNASPEQTSTPTPTPPATAAAAPALDVSMMNSGPDLSTTSLDSEVRNAATPALAASLRLTEEARKELEQGGGDDALRDLARAVSIDPSNSFAYFYLGRGYILKKNYGQALTFLKRAEIGFVSRAEWLGETLSFEGVCHEELGHLTDAAQAYQRALAAAPNNLMARVGYGRVGAAIAPPANLDAPPPGARDVQPPPLGSTVAPAPSEAPPPPPPAPSTHGVGGEAPPQ